VEGDGVKTCLKLPLLIALVACCSCKQKDTEQRAIAQCGGDPAAGKLAIQQYGCGSCHTIPGIPGAEALVGPSLQQIASRNFIGGVLQNNGTNLIRWIQNAPAVDDKTAMPDVYVTPRDATNIATYLYTLK
jgi:cytochrome c